MKKRGSTRSQKSRTLSERIAKCVATAISPKGAQGIAQFDRLRRLDEQRAGAAGFVVDDPGRTAPGVAPDRNDITIPPHRHRCIRGRRAALQAPEQGVKPLQQTLPGRLYLTPGGSQAGAGRVEQVSVGID